MTVALAVVLAAVLVMVLAGVLAAVLAAVLAVAPVPHLQLVQFCVALRQLFVPGIHEGNRHSSLRIELSFPLSLQDSSHR